MALWLMWNARREASEKAGTLACDLSRPVPISAPAGRFDVGQFRNTEKEKFNTVSSAAVQPLGVCRALRFV
jgi:hypothetical protein